MSDNPHPFDSSSYPYTSGSQQFSAATIPGSEISQFWEYAAGDTIELHRSQNASVLPIEYSHITPQTIMTGSVDAAGLHHDASLSPRDDAQIASSGGTTETIGRARYRHGTPASKSSPVDKRESSTLSSEHIGQTSITAIDVIPNPLPVTVTSIVTSGQTRVITGEIDTGVARSLPPCITTVTITVTDPTTQPASPKQFKPASKLPLPVVDFQIDPTTSPRNITYLPPITLIRSQRINTGAPEYRYPAIPTSGGIFNYSGRRVHALLTPVGVIRLYARTDDTDIEESLNAFDRTAAYFQMVEQLSLPDFRRLTDVGALQPRSSRAGNALESW